MTHNTIRPYGAPVQTAWGEVASPYITYDPASYRYRMPTSPLLMRGYPTARPRPFNYSNLTGVATGLGEDTGSSDVTKLLLAVGLGILVGWLLTRGSGGARRNPDTHENPDDCESSLHCSQRCVCFTKTGRARLRAAGRRRAHKARRDHKGRFVPER